MDVAALISQLGDSEPGKEALAQLVSRQSATGNQHASLALAEQILTGGALPKVFEILETDVTNEDVMKLLFNLAKEKTLIPKMLAAGVLPALRMVCERWPPGVRKNPNCNHISVISKISVTERTEEPMVTAGLHVELLRAAQDEQTCKSAFNALLNIAFAKQCKQPLLDIGAIPAALQLLAQDGDTQSSAFKFLRSMSLHTPCFPVFVEAGMISVLKNNLLKSYKDEQNIWFISNLSDVPDACLMFCQQGFLPRLKAALADVSWSGENKFRQWALTAVWRMSRVEVCKPYLLEHHFQDNLLAHTKLGDEPILAMMGLALLVGREEEGRNSELIQTDRSMIQKLINRLSEAVGEYTSGRSAFVKTKATVLDYLTAIGCVVVSDVNKALMTTSEVIWPLVDCADKCRADIPALTAATDILLELTFSDAALNILQQEKFLSVLRDLKNAVTDQPGSQSLDALLFRLQPLIPRRRKSLIGSELSHPSSPVMEEKKMRGGESVFVSYHPSHQTLVSRLVKDLQDHGHTVWFNMEQQGNGAEGMAEGLEAATIVLMDISPQYKESANCRLEGMTAMQLNKKLVPLMFEAKYKPTGWLGLLMGMRPWYAAWDEKEHYDELLKAILKEIALPVAISEKRRRDPGVAPPPPALPHNLAYSPRSAPPGYTPMGEGELLSHPVAKRGRPKIGDMTIEDVGRWLTNNGIPDGGMREACVDGCGLLWLQQHAGTLMAVGRGAEALDFVQSNFEMKIGHAMRLLEKLKEVK